MLNLIKKLSTKADPAADAFIAGLRHNEGRAEPWFGAIEPQIDLGGRVGHVMTDAHDVRVQFASAVARRNVISKITNERRVSFQNAA